jgi:hypothetical protein
VSQWTQLSKLIRELEPKIADELVRAIEAHAAAIDIPALISALTKNDVEEAIRLAAINARPLFPLTELIRSSYVNAAIQTSTEQRGVISGEFGFNGRSPAAESWVTQNAARLVTNVSEESKLAVRDLVLNGLELNRTPESVARDIAGRLVGNKRVGSIIGLTVPQTRAVINARAALAEGSMRYFEYRLRDKRFDSLVRKAIKQGRKLTAAEINKISGAHKEKSLSYRAKVVARTENHKSMAAGRHESYRQMLSSPGVEGITLRWQHNLSMEPRIEHVAMNGRVIQFDERFLFPDGTAMRYPNDEFAPAEHVIGCRCIAVYKVQVERG